jgi:hypothetical protein
MPLCRRPVTFLQNLSGLRQAPASGALVGPQDFIFGKFKERMSIILTFFPRVAGPSSTASMILMFLIS